MLAVAHPNPWSSPSPILAATFQKSRLFGISSFQWRRPPRTARTWRSALRASCTLATRIRTSHRTLPRWVRESVDLTRSLQLLDRSSCLSLSAPPSPRTPPQPRRRLPHRLCARPPPPSSPHRHSPSPTLSASARFDPDFARHVRPGRPGGGASLDWSAPDAAVALTRALLWQHFGRSA